MACDYNIELFFRVLKQGCQIEQLRVQTDQRLWNALAIYAIVAWRIHNITMVGRAYPEVSCEVVFEPREWHTLYTMQHHCHPPPTPPPLREMVRSLAQLGGFLARKGDGEPGLNTIWQGYQRLHEFIYAVDTYQTVNGLESQCVREKCIMLSARGQAQGTSGETQERSLFPVACTPLLATVWHRHLPGDLTRFLLPNHWLFCHRTCARSLGLLLCPWWPPWPP
jgi:hypothetical protein